MEDAESEPARASSPPLDLRLLHGFRFACRPDCGLCCYATPRVERGEQDRLLQIAPEMELLERGSERFIAARPDGGACQFLLANRCRVHAARPHPCREFPLTVHVGRRLQVSIVLSCPGVELESLRRPPSPLPRRRESSGLERELSSLRERVGPSATRRLEATTRRGRKVEKTLAAEGRWQDDEAVRRSLGPRLPLPSPSDFPVEDPPTVSEGLERLPLFFDGRAGPVAIASGLGGWELLELRPTGGADRRGLVVAPERPPRLDEEAERLLHHYLRYALARDAFLASVHLEMLEGDEGTVAEWTLAALHALAATVVARAAIRTKLHGGEGVALTADDIERGIRSTDQDWLDRPTWGERL